MMRITKYLISHKITLKKIHGISNNPFLKVASDTSNYTFFTDQVVKS